MTGRLSRAQLRQLLAAQAPGLDAAALDRRLAVALRAARIADKPAYRPEEVAAIGQALMAIALQDVTEGISRLEAIAADPEIEGAG